MALSEQDITCFLEGMAPARVGEGGGKLDYHQVVVLLLQVQASCRHSWLQGHHLCQR